jgi:hypothetical protein
MRRLLLPAALVVVFLFVWMAGTGVAAANVLLGNSSVASSKDNDAAGLAEAFNFSAGASGTAQTVAVYVDSGSSATGLVVGLYADGGGHPGSLLASGSDSAPAAGQWNAVTLDSTPTLSSGTSYWLAFVGTGGQLNFRDENPGAGRCSENSPQSNLTSLPSSWAAGPGFATCSLSADVNGTASPTAPPTTPSNLLPIAPLNIGLPGISGTARQGQTLTASNGSWSNSPGSYAYQWQDCDSSGSNCTNISGATSSSYTLASGDIGYTVRSVVTATNGAGSASAVSAATAPVTSPPGPPASFGSSPAGPVTGQSVHFDGTASTCAAAPCSYTWADDPPSGGSWPLGSGQSLDFTFKNVGTKYVTLTVTDALSQTATVEHDVVVTSAAAPSNPPPSAPSNIGLPGISGTARQGQTLTASNGSWSNSPGSYAYQWQDCDSSGSNCTNISGATSSSYTLVSGDVGDTLRAVVSATNAGGSASATSAQTPVVAAAPAPAPSNTALPAISGTAQQGQTLTASNGSWSNSPGSYAYQWQGCDSSGNTCTSISGATGSSYTLAASDVGHTARAVVTATNAGGSNSATSAATAVIAANVTGSPSNTALPTISGTATQAQTLSSTNGSWTGSPTSYAYQWRQCDSSGNTCTSISGATGSSYTLAASDVGHTARAVVTATNAGGSNSATSAATGVVSAASSGSCNLNATPSSFGSQVSAASAGQTICLASGDYGTWAGTNKAITVKAAAGATPTMNDNFGSGASGFTLDGMTGMSGTISGAAHDITIQNSSFNGEQDVLMDQMQNANIVFNGDTFNNFVGTARLWTQNYNASGGSGATPSGVIVEHSAFTGTTSGGADGVRCDGASIQILDNSFSGINDASNGGNHGDPIQIYGGTHCIIKGNYFHGMVNSATCSLGEWDGGDHNVFENNVVDTGGCYEAVGILADQGSLVDHNTFITPAGGCFANPQSQCGSAAVGAKSGQSSSGTVYRDNVMTGFGNGNGGVNASYSENHNLCTSSCGGGSGDIIGAATLAGGAQPTTHDGFLLSGSSLGRSAASDGTNIGVYATGS